MDRVCYTHILLILLVHMKTCFGFQTQLNKKIVDSSLEIIYDLATKSLGSLCVTQNYQSLPIPVNPSMYEHARQKADLSAMFLQDLGVTHHNNGIQSTVAKDLLSSDRTIMAVRVLLINSTSGRLESCDWWESQGMEVGGPRRVTDMCPELRRRLQPEYPWYEDPDSSPALRSPKFMESPANMSFKGWWTYPYYSCPSRKWLLSYSIPIPPLGRVELKGFLSLDIDLSVLEINQCEKQEENSGSLEISFFYDSHKCENATTKCIYNQQLPFKGWNRGSYTCKCREGYYSPHYDGIFNGTLVEMAWQEKISNISNTYDEMFVCRKCAPGCYHCTDFSPCLATYHWSFRIALLSFSIFCVFYTIGLIVYMYKHKKLKVFKVASPIFLAITLIGCAIMYSEMAAIFPVLDMYSCIATKWTRHLGFCITYTALLMKTWRVSLTYRVKSAHKVKLTDKQLLQWMMPILLIMLIYLSTWTLSGTPTAEDITDSDGLRFKQCTYNWWDHSLAIGEVFFLAWGVRVCYNVRNAESLYNEARLISYAIYNIAAVNIIMIAFHLFIFPRAGPDIKYLLGFIRTQLSTSVTIALVFGPKVMRVLRGQGDQWDNRARSRGVSASFSLNGIGLVPEDAPDLYQENEELKEEIQKLAAQIEFMKIVHMEVNNRHIKPKLGGYFSSANPAAAIQSPLSRPGCLLGKPPDEL
ncbi:probable G-protein coupled receptor CG31760 isoform X2 [Agrilus planipennis]|uniref:Probable G-protein coupled receptor CG31760 isoform X2 n=1 Tax=Agrilus planipennis TaxID=224129 RepID=A0A1W4WVN1_AGRPL|nr:probable G-protein coupled receptor CG31760 isoform X2 [Agrilus planipennis]